MSAHVAKKAYERKDQILLNLLPYHLRDVQIDVKISHHLKQLK